MIEVTQQFLHDPSNGVWGDCQRAVLASLLELPIEEVPHFALEAKDDASKFYDLIREFLQKRNLAIWSIPFDGGISLVDLLYSVAKSNPGIFYQLSGTSKNGTDHVVICLGDRIVWDPAIDKSGIVGPETNGYWWISILIPLSLGEWERGGYRHE